VRFRALIEQQDKRLGWTQLRKLAELSFIKRSYAWVFFIPIIAKGLSKITDEFIILTVFEYRFSVPSQLPFSWTILYFSGLCFLSAYVLFLTQAPRLIKDHGSVSSFFDDRKSFRHLIDYAQEIEDPFEMGFWQASLKREGDTRDEEKLLEFYWDLRMKGDLTHGFSRWTCGSILYSGLAMVTWLILENTYFVISSLQIT